MKFLLFNITVSAAAIYLLVGDPGATARQVGLPEAAVSAIYTLSHKAKKTVVDNVVEVPQPIAQPKPAPIVAKATLKPVDEQRTKPIIDAQVAKTAPPIKQAAFVPKKPVHSAPSPKRNPAIEARKGTPVPLPPQLALRRAEVLGNGKADGKFAVKDGSTMMSPGDRYRELSKLVDDMELVYFNSLGN